MQWNIDPAHTSLEFSVRHMGVFTVRGTFGGVTGSIESSEDGELQSVKAVIDASTIDTRSAQRDGHLVSGDFLDVESHPTLAFESTSVEPKGNGHYAVTGNFTIRGETRPVTLDVEISEPILDPYGMQRAGALVTGKLSRQQWGLTWNQVLESGSMLVSDEVKFTIDVQAFVPAPVPVG